jgi:putative ABC transport system permease protein
MIRNYLKVAFRNLLKRKGFSLINIFGLATGMAVCLLIVLFVQSELSYDQHHEKADNIYRVALDRHYPGRTTSYAIIPQSYAGAFKTEFAEVEESVRIYDFAGNNNFLLRIGEKNFEESSVLAADSNFFRVFSSKFLQGDPTSALLQANSVVLNETTAKKYYGSVAAAIGKTFQTDDNDNNVFKITGVIADWPQNSHFNFDLLISTTGFQFTRDVNFVGFSAYTYLLLKTGTAATAFQAKFSAFVKKYVSGDIERRFQKNYEQFIKDGNGYNYYLQPLKKIHLTSDLEAELAPNGSIRAVYIFSMVAVFILALACVNFINLSTARSVERAREVGIRKTFGSDRRSLIAQFLIESTIISLLALLVAFCLITLLLPLFNQISGKSLTVTWFLQPLTLALIVAFALFVGLVAGLYPAFILSSFKPILVLKGRFKSQKFGLALRNGLVVFQFAISVVLIVCTIIVNNQMEFMMGEKLGFKKDHVIVVEGTGRLQENTEAFKTELGRIAGVESVSGTSAMPGQTNFFGITFQEISSQEQVTGRGIFVDDNFEDVLGLELKEGRFFSKDFSTDSLSLILNEKAVEEFKLKNPIGARMTSPDGPFNGPNGETFTYIVVGVVRDFHFQSLHSKITPLIFSNNSRFDGVAGQMAVRIKASEFNKAVSGIENTWKKFINNRPFHYSFLDQTLAQQYHAEQTTQRIFTVFSLLAIFIACIGLLGLAAYTTQQRIKEIGIRKVLGASMQQIITMLSKDFLKLVVIGSLIAFPLAWWGMHKWLEDFAYHVNVSWWVFIVAAALATIVALGTISFQAIKAAMSNPVKSLRTE